MHQLAETYPVQQICAVWNMPRSTYYYQARRQDDAELVAALQRLAAHWPTYGTRRLTAALRREGWTINRKRVRRLMQQLGLSCQIKRKTRHTTQSGHGFRRYPNRVQDLVITHADQVWVADLTYIRLLEEFVYLAVVMDVFTRTIRGWHLSRPLDASLTVRALERALATHRPEIHHSDQGVQYACPEYVQRLEQAGVQLSMAEVGAAWQNGYAERLMRTIKEEEVALSAYQNYQEAYHQLGQFLDEVYMHKRIHSALGYLTPVEFESQWRAQSTTPSSSTR